MWVFPQHQLSNFSGSLLSSVPLLGVFAPEMHVTHSLTAFKVLLKSQVLREASSDRVFHYATLILMCATLVLFLVYFSFVHTTGHFLR